MKRLCSKDTSFHFMRAQNEELSRMMEALEKDKQAFVAELQGRLEEERQHAAAEMQRKLAEELEQRDLVLKVRRA